MSFSNYAELEILDWIGGNGAPGAVTAPAPYAKLHLGDPGEDGTANAASNTTRQSVSFGAAASGAITNDAAVTWTSVSATETYSHVSIWDASTGGNCLGSGALSSSVAVTSGDNFSIPVGDFDMTCD
jgi:hypothetical protein